MIYFITGVSGSGKTTVGQLLAAQIGLPFFDADDFHPEANIAKMRAGQPLTDTDRAGWLSALHTQALNCTRANGAVFACSALKNQYRKQLSEGIESQTKFILLEGDFDVILSRLQTRKDHYMPPSLLQSQFDILELSADIMRISIEYAPEEIVAQILTQKE